MIRARPLLAAIGVALLAATVAGGVTLAILKLQARTNPQSVDIRSGVTISEDSAIVQAATRAKPAVVSIVTTQQPELSTGSGYLVTSDGYIVTSIGVLAGATSITVLVPNDSRLHDARLIDYDCDTAVAVVKIDQVIGVAMPGPTGENGFALNAADIQDDVQQIVQSGQVMVPSLGASTADIGALGALKQLPEGAQIATVKAGGPADSAGLAIG